MSTSRPLIKATIDQDLPQIKTLLQQRRDPNERHPTSGATSLMIAVDKKNLELTKLLIEHGADIEALDDDGFSIIDYLLKPDSKYSEQEQKDFIAIFKNTPNFYIRKEASDNIIKLLQVLNYADSSIVKGICFGISSVARHYFTRGLKGFTEFKTMLRFISSKTAEELKKELLLAESIRKEIVNKEKAKLLLKYREKLSTCKTINDRLDKFNIKEKRTAKIIDEAIKNKFTDTTRKERKKLVKAIIKYKFTKPAHAPKDSQLKRKIDTLLPTINNDIFEATVNYLTQRRLAGLTKKELRIKKLDPMLLKMRPFLQSIALYQNPDQELFPARINRLRAGQSLAATFPLVSSSKEAKAGLAISHQGSSFGAFSINELERYFNCWTLALKEQANEKRGKKPIHFHFSSTTHAILVTYFPENNTWVLLDHGEIKTINCDKLAILAKNVFYRLRKEDDDQHERALIDIIVTGHEQHRLDNVARKVTASKDWQTIHEFTDEKLKKPVINNEFHLLASHCTNTELVQQFANKKPVTLGAIITCFIGETAAAIFAACAIITLPIPPLAAGLFALSAATAFGTKKVVTRTSGPGAVSASATQKTMHDMIEDDHDRMMRFPSTHRGMQQTLLKSAYIDKKLAKKEIEQATASRTTPLTGLFSPDHLLYCRMQTAWKNAWQPNEESYFAAEIDVIKGIKKPGFFDVAPKLFSHHKHYQAITNLLTISKEHKSVDFAGDLGKVTRELNALLTSTLFKQSVPTQLYKKLKWIRDQISVYDRREPEQRRAPSYSR